MKNVNLYAEALYQMENSGNLVKTTMTEIGLYMVYEHCQVLNNHGHLTVMWDDKAVEVR